MILYNEEIGLLVRHYGDNAQTLPIIQQLAHQGNRYAIDRLVRHYGDNAQTLAIIQQQAHQGNRYAIKKLKKIN